MITILYNIQGKVKEVSLKMWRAGESRRKVTLVTSIRHRWAWKAAGAVGSVVRDETKNCCRRAYMKHC
jgi:hypothetical protein